MQECLFEAGRTGAFGGAQAGWSLAANAAAPDTRTISRAISRAPGDIHPIVTGGAGIKMTYLPLWAGGTFSVTMAVREL